MPVNIYEMGLIYNVNVDPSGAVGIQMTLTSPNCPSAQELPAEVETKVRAVPGLTEAKVEVVFDPPWDPPKMSAAAKLDLHPVSVRLKCFADSSKKEGFQASNQSSIGGESWQGL